MVLTANQYGPVPLTPAWTPASDSLIAGLVPSTASGNFSEEASGRNVNALTAGGNLTIATIANSFNSGTTAGTNYVTCGNAPGAGSTVTYTLPVSSYGYNITNITVDSG